MNIIVLVEKILQLILRKNKMHFRKHILFQPKDKYGIEKISRHYLSLILRTRVNPIFVCKMVVEMISFSNVRVVIFYLDEINP